jgi:hypothetical protein
MRGFASVCSRNRVNTMIGDFEDMGVLKVALIARRIGSLHMLLRIVAGA